MAYYRRKVYYLEKSGWTDSGDFSPGLDIKPKITDNVLIAVILTTKEHDNSYSENKSSFVNYRTDRHDRLIAALEQHGIPEELKEHGIRNLGKLLKD